MNKQIRNCYLNIQGWMVTDLRLKGNDLFLFALIYGFCQNREAAFTGSLDYLCQWTNASERTVQNTINRLVNAGLIIKQSRQGETNVIKVNHDLIDKILNDNDAETAQNSENSDFCDDADKSIDQDEKSHENANHDEINASPVTAKSIKITAETLVNQYGVSERVALDWLAMRKSKRAPISGTVINGLIREAGKANLTLDNVLQICVERNWQGFQAAWLLREVNDLKQQIERNQQKRSIAEQVAEFRKKHGLTQ